MRELVIGGETLQNANGLQEVRAFWSTEACGTHFIQRFTDEHDFFSKYREFRYRTEWHIPAFASFAQAKGKRVLEIGCGNGADGVMFTSDGRDVESFVRDAEQQIKEHVQLPENYIVEFGGQFKNLEQARTRLAVVVPSALLLIFVLIFLAFGSVRQALIVYSGIPLAMTGGVAALWLRGMPFSITAAVGFIALSGVAVLNGLVLVTYFNQLREQGRRIRDAVVEGSFTRLRPVLMTALVASLGFVPMAIATGTGAEVQRPLATVVIGGVISSTLLTLIVLPVLYSMFEREHPPVASHGAETTPVDGSLGSEMTA